VIGPWGEMPKEGQGTGALAVGGKVALGGVASETKMGTAENNAAPNNGGERCKYNLNGRKELVGNDWFEGVAL